MSFMTWGEFKEEIDKLPADIDMYEVLVECNVGFGNLQKIKEENGFYTLYFETGVF